MELRSRATKIVGERFYIYASKGRAAWGKGQDPSKVWSNDLHVGKPPDWMIELAEQIKMIEPDALLPTGVIVGSAVIEKVTQLAGSGQQAAGSPVPELPDAASRELQAMYAWHLSDVKRAKKLRTPKRHPQPVWFKPF